VWNLEAVGGVGVGTLLGPEGSDEQLCWFGTPLRAIASFEPSIQRIR
jgi:hypothetical protein